MGRPKKQIDEALVERLAKCQCSDRQIAGRCGVDHHTIARRFGPKLASWREWGKTNLTEAMWANAVEGKDTKAQIHLAKQHLGHADKAEVVVGQKDTIDPIAQFRDDPELLKVALAAKAEYYARIELSKRSGGHSDSGVPVPSPHPSTGNGRNGDSHKPGPEPSSN